MFDCICDFPGVRSGNLGDRICLADDKKIFDLADKVFGFALYGTPKLS